MELSSKQFVIQQHQTPKGIHWDLMLQADQALLTWRLSVPPKQISNEEASAQKIADHPLRFLTYEGPVQNQTGSVKIADTGTCTIEETQNALQIALNGQILHGNFILKEIRKQDWIFQKAGN